MRKAMTPTEEKKLQRLADWLVVRRAPLIRALMNDIANELDTLTDRQFLTKIPVIKAELAVLEIIRNMTYENFTLPKQTEINNEIDCLVKDLT